MQTNWKVSTISTTCQIYLSNLFWKHLSGWPLSRYRRTMDLVHPIYLSSKSLDLAKCFSHSSGTDDFWPYVLSIFRINNAGTNSYKYKALSELEDEDLVNIVQTNVLGVMLCCKEVILNFLIPHCMQESPSKLFHSPSFVVRKLDLQVIPIIVKFLFRCAPVLCKFATLVLTCARAICIFCKTFMSRKYWK